MWIRRLIDRNSPAIEVLLQLPTEPVSAPWTVDRVREIQWAPGSGEWHFDPDTQILTIQWPFAAWVAALRADVTQRSESVHRQLETVQASITSLDAVIRPLFTTPDAAQAHTLEWRNLWAFWQFVPGTLRPRVLLTLWTFKDWWIIGAAMFLLGSWAPWRGLTALGALLVLSVAGFLVHELWMRWWGTRVCRLEEVDPHEYNLKFTPTFERFVSRYMA